MSLPLRHYAFPGLSIICTLKLVPEAKFRNITVNSIRNSTRIVQDDLIFTSFYLVVFLGIKRKKVLFSSLTLLCKIGWQAAVHFFLIQMSRKNLKKRI